MDVNQEKQPFERIEVSREQALEMFSDNSFKASKAANFTSNRCLFDASPTYILSFLCWASVWRFNQVEIIKDLPEDKTITVYRCGPLVDLCRGPHIPSTSFVKAFRCLKVMYFLSSCS